MDEKSRRIAEKNGILDRVQALEAQLLKNRFVPELEFDLRGFQEHGDSIILIPRYDIPVSLPDYYAVRRDVLNSILKTAYSFGLKHSGDRIEDYGEHFYIVRNCDKTWNQQTVHKPLDAQIQDSAVRAAAQSVLGDMQQNTQKDR